MLVVFYIALLEYQIFTFLGLHYSF
jgi:hypothetical protein